MNIGLSCRFIALLAATISLLIGGCKSQVYSYRYKLTVQIEHDGSILTQSSVIDVKKFKKTYHMGGPGGEETYIQGVAPIFNLGADGWLVLPLWGGLSSDKWLPRDGRKCANYYVYQPVQLAETMQRPWKKVELASNQRPEFFWFSGTTWESGRSICGVQLPDVISPTTSVRSITMEPTQEPIIERIESAPPWLEDARQHYPSSRGHYSGKIESG